MIPHGKRGGLKLAGEVNARIESELEVKDYLWGKEVCYHGNDGDEKRKEDLSGLHGGA